MADTRDVIRQAYAAFNRRDIDGALALMSADVSWPKASEGGRAVGKEAIREYWTRQWAEFDPRVEPEDVTVRADGRTEVTVHQMVRTLAGAVLSDLQVVHVFTISEGLIERMDLVEGESAFGRG